MLSLKPKTKKEYKTSQQVLEEKKEFYENKYNASQGGHHMQLKIKRLSAKISKIIQ